MLCSFLWSWNVAKCPKVIPQTKFCSRVVFFGNSVVQKLCKAGFFYNKIRELMALRILGGEIFPRFERVPWAAPTMLDGHLTPVCPTAAAPHGPPHASGRRCPRCRRRPRGGTTHDPTRPPARAWPPPLTPGRRIPRPIPSFGILCAGKRERRRFPVSVSGYPWHVWYLKALV